MTPLEAPDLRLPAEEAVVVSAWFVEPGDTFVEGDRLVELLCGEITFDVAAPVSGRLLSIERDVDETVTPGIALASIEPDAE